jgi:hypothetical protein
MEMAGKDNEKEEPVRLSVEDAQSVLAEETQRNVEAAGAEIQEILDRRNLRISISMVLLEDGRNVPNIALMPRQALPTNQ